MLLEIQQGWKRISWPLAEFFGLFLIFFNILLSYQLPNFSIAYVGNTKPFGFDISLLTTFLIQIFIFFGLYKGGAMDKYRLASALIIAGSFSNFLERLYFGEVKDYLDIGIAYINLADIQIWLGLILLNWQIWFWNKKIKKEYGYGLSGYSQKEIY